LTTTKVRKIEHLEITLYKNVKFREKTTWLEYVHLIHCSLPEMNLEDVDTSINFLNRRIKYPIMINSMTGGPKETFIVNKMLAQAAEEYGIPMGVGSQRIALESKLARNNFRRLRKVAPSTILISNIGAVEATKLSPSEVRELVEMIDADALFIHLNPLHEALQWDGKPYYRNVVSAISKICDTIDVPVIVKETGCGISREVASMLIDAGVYAISVDGSGGTSWAAVEYYRATDEALKSLCRAFWDWGIPTAASIIEAYSANAKVIAAGGITNGIDIVKAVSIGAIMGSIARPFVKQAWKGMKYIREYIESLIREIKLTLFLTGSRKLLDVRSRNKVVIYGPLKEWVEYRGLKLPFAET